MDALFCNGMSKVGDLSREAILQVCTLLLNFNIQKGHSHPVFPLFFQSLKDEDTSVFKDELNKSLFKVITTHTLSRTKKRKTIRAQRSGQPQRCYMPNKIGLAPTLFMVSLFPYSPTYKRREKRKQKATFCRRRAIKFHFFFRRIASLHLLALFLYGCGFVQTGKETAAKVKRFPLMAFPSAASVKQLKGEEQKGEN